MVVGRPHTGDMPTTTQTPLSKTQVANLVRGIRRDSLRIKDMVETLDTARQQPTYKGVRNEPLVDAVKRFPTYATMIHDLLGDIDGQSALLREALNLGDM